MIGGGIAGFLIGLPLWMLLWILGAVNNNAISTTHTPPPDLSHLSKVLPPKPPNAPRTNFALRKKLYRPEVLPPKPPSVPRTNNEFNGLALSLSFGAIGALIGVIFGLWKGLVTYL